ncbi:MAG: peptide ABC transporter substrate-binding protein [Lentisphaeria bacterium]|jgi:oligopeptide transport system substrate-binding protein|nr:peptide ABC transporter substrate-binding protein [Lentisphaeria bacterium]
MKQRFLSIRQYLLPALIPLLLCSCGREPVFLKSPAGQPGDGVPQILHLGNGAEPKALDPHVVTGVTEHNIISALLEGLVTENPKTLEPQPGAAESWTVSDDGTVYTFLLRSNGKWSNGDAVTAPDFVFSFERMLSPGLSAEYAEMLFVMKNAAAFHEGRVTDFSQVGVRAVNDHTLEITLNAGTPYFLSMLNHYSWYPVHPPTILKHGKMDERHTPWTRPGNYVGNGVFVLDTWEVNKEIVVKKNPLHWDAKIVRLEAIHFRAIEKALTEERAFRAGDLHVTSTVPLDKIEKYQQNSPELLMVSPYIGTYYYLFNVEQPPLDDGRVRKALSMSIDRAAICTHVLKAGQLPAYHFVPPDTGGYTSQARVTYDIAAAKKLLAAAGYPDGKGFPGFELLYNTNESHRKIAEVIQQMWQKNLNINVVLKNQEWKVYLDSTQQGDFQVARAGWIGDYVDPNTFLDLWITGGGNNRTRWSNGDYDNFIASAASTSDAAVRFEAFQKAETILLDELPIMPIYLYVSLSLIQPGVRGWYPTLLDHHPYKYVYLE